MEFSVLLCPNSPISDAGKPLGDADFFLASQLPRIPTNMTSEKLMKVGMPMLTLLNIMKKFLADCRGRVKRKSAQPRARSCRCPESHQEWCSCSSVSKVWHSNCLTSCYRNHWADGIIPYTLDAAFTTAERAVIAQGIADIEAASCLR